MVIQWGRFKTLFLEPISIQTYSSPEMWKINTPSIVISIVHASIVRLIHIMDTGLNNVSVWVFMLVNFSPGTPPPTTQKPNTATPSGTVYVEVPEYQ